MNLERLIECVKSSAGRFRLQSLTPSSMAIYAAASFKESGKNILVVAPDPMQAETLVGDIAFFLGGTENVLYLPQFETLPYEPLPPLPEIAAARLTALLALNEAVRPLVCVTTPSALTQKCLPPDALGKSFFHMKVGQSPDREELAGFFTLRGYTFCDPVEEPGAFAFRGGILDCFPPDSDTPLRIEFFGDQVESIRRFDVDTQRSIAFLKEILIPPMKETNYIGRDADSIIEKLDKLHEGSSISSAKIISKIRNREFFPAMDLFLPLFHGELVSPVDLIPKNTAAVFCDPERIDEHIDMYGEEITQGYSEARERGELYPPPESLYLDGRELKEFFNTLPGVDLAPLSTVDEGPLCASAAASEMEKLRGAFSRFVYNCDNRLKKGVSTLVVAQREGSLLRIKNLFADEDIGVRELRPDEMAECLRGALRLDNLSAPSIMAVVGKLSSGFHLPPANLAVVTEEEIFGRRVESKIRREAVFATDFSDVRPGDFIVHRDHGIGVYHGARAVHAGETKDEYLELEYAQDQRLFLPIASIHLIEKYSGAGGPRPVLDRMGGKTWSNTRAKVKKGIMMMAKELLQIYARRETEKAHSFSKADHFSREFSDSFEYLETPDQQAAIEDMTGDMESEKPMDRLICGDVGYGKTEVALRAAFKASLDGKQTAVLCPTTLLVNQHLENFKKRLAPFAVRVEELSRFVSRQRQKETLKDLKEGKVDILIGTHRLLQKDVAFSDLGLLIVDEEQRFGVTHKEKLKKMRAVLDVLTLSATPIPRTLHMSFSGIRDISVINTPPPGRRSIKTFIRKFGDDIIRHAVERELSRGGQVFFVHNKVESIKSMHVRIKKILPGLRMAVGHGQMSARELEKTMENFVKRKIDLLLCTTIIESGLDIPNANTIIINGADKLGLAQLYQLRGRVGRARHRAYAYLLVPDVMAPLARKRLKAIEELSELGSGFKLAARDMEIRGAGNMLGPQQSGNITSVGFETYCRMMAEAVEELKSGGQKQKVETELQLDFSGRLDKSYVPSLEQRMNLYSRLNRETGVEGIKRIAEEISDRFGPMPDAAKKLIEGLLIRAATAELDIKRLEISGDSMSLHFVPEAESIVKVTANAAQEFSSRVGLASNNTITVDISLLDEEVRSKIISEFFVRCVNVEVDKGL